MWKRFNLISVISRLAGSTDTDDPEDSEYNFMAEDQKEEREEYRTDRAVKISRKIILASACLLSQFARLILRPHIFKYLQFPTLM